MWKGATNTWEMKIKCCGCFSKAIWWWKRCWKSESGESNWRSRRRHRRRSTKRKDNWVELISFQLVSSLTESSWAAVNRRSLQRHTQKKMTSITTITATIPRTHPSALPPLPTGLPLGESHPSLSSPSRTLRQLLITSALTPSSPRAARRPPISSTRVASRTVGGSPWRNLRRWRGRTRSSSL